jgi:hypothetical protein
MKFIVAGLVMFQQALFVAVPAAVATSTLVGCATPQERQDARQETRVGERTEDRYERRRGQ